MIDRTPSWQSLLQRLPTLPTLLESRTPSAYDPLTPPAEVPCLCSPAWRCQQHTLAAMPGGAPRAEEDSLTMLIVVVCAICFAAVCATVWGII